MTATPLGRRDFLRFAAATAAAVLAARAGWAAPAGKKPRLKKAVKYAMVQTKGSHRDKFELLKKLGFQGVEIDSPDGPRDLDELVKARDATAVAVHGVIDSRHWKGARPHPAAAV